MRRKYILILAFGIGLLMIGVCEAKLYKWVDQDGVLHNRRMQETGDSRSSYVLPVVYFNGELMYSPQVITVLMKYKNY